MSVGVFRGERGRKVEAGSEAECIVTSSASLRNFLLTKIILTASKLALMVAVVLSTRHIDEKRILLSSPLPWVPGFSPPIFSVETNACTHTRITHAIHVTTS